MSRKEFVHLHMHTEYSLLDGAIRIAPLCNRVKNLGMPAVAITDHGNMFGALDFYLATRKTGIKPIVGCEVYVAPGDRTDRSSRAGGSEASYHLVLLAQNVEGYRNLCKLVSAAYLDGFYYKPRVDKELLQAHNGGLIAMSACLGGEIPRRILDEQMKEAEQVASQYADIFDDGRFYLELQDNGIPEQKVVNEGLLCLSRSLSLPLVATNDCHYLNPEDAQAHDILLCIQTNKLMDDPNRMRFNADDFYLSTRIQGPGSFPHNSP